MAYKSGVAIIVTYQAANAQTGLTIKLDIYDEAHALDAVKSVAAMTEIGTTGRYYATFTPDAAGEWIALMYKDGGGGEVVKAFRVATGDEFGIKAAVDALNNISMAQVATELGTYDAPTKAEMDTGHGLLATPAQVATELGTYDAPTKAELDVLGTTALGTATALATVDTEVGAIQTDLDNATDGLGAIKAAVDAVGSPAMVG